MTVVNPTVDKIADVIMDNVEAAAACSHLPQNVGRLWQDANARYFMARKIAEALELDAEPSCRCYTVHEVHNAACPLNDA